MAIAGKNGKLVIGDDTPATVAQSRVGRSTYHLMLWKQQH